MLRRQRPCPPLLLHWREESCEGTMYPMSHISRTGLGLHSTLEHHVECFTCSGQLILDIPIGDFPVSASTMAGGWHTGV